MIRRCKQTVPTCDAVVGGWARAGPTRPVRRYPFIRPSRRGGSGEEHDFRGQVPFGRYAPIRAFPAPVSTEVPSLELQTSTGLSTARWQDKANFVRASLRSQEVVCTFFFAARRFPIGEARRRFFRFLFAINVPRDGRPPLLRQSTVDFLNGSRCPRSWRTMRSEICWPLVSSEPDPLHPVKPRAIRVPGSAGLLGLTGCRWPVCRPAILALTQI